MKPAVSVALAALLASSAQGQVLLFDDFEDGADPAWGNEFGAWVVTAGEYEASSPGNAPPTYTLLPYIVDDMDLVVDIRQLQDGGIWLHVDDTRQNGVLLVMGGSNHTYPGFYWHIVTGGSYSSQLGLSGTVVTLGGNHQLRVRVRGDTYQVFVDGNPAAASTLATNLFPTGRVGLYDNTSGQLRFDNVLLTIPCGSDYNDDAEVDILDFLDFIDDFSACENLPAPCGNLGDPDLNADTTIDILDFLDFIDAFGSGC